MSVFYHLVTIILLPCCYHLFTTLLQLRYNSFASTCLPHCDYSFFTLFTTFYHIVTTLIPCILLPPLCYHCVATLLPFRYYFVTKLQPLCHGFVTLHYFVTTLLLLLLYKCVITWLPPCYRHILAAWLHFTISLPPLVTSLIPLYYHFDTTLLPLFFYHFELPLFLYHFGTTFLPRCNHAATTLPFYYHLVTTALPQYCLSHFVTNWSPLFLYHFATTLLQL